MGWLGVDLFQFFLYRVFCPETRLLVTRLNITSKSHIKNTRTLQSYTLFEIYTQKMLGTNPSSEIQEISSTAKPTKQMEAVEENLIDGKHELEDEIIQEYENEDNIDEENDNINNNDNEGEEETTMTRSITPIPTTQTIPTPEIVIEEPPAPFISQTASILTTSTPNVTLARYDIDVDTDVKECFACGMDIRDESPLAVFGRFWHKDCFRGEVCS